MDNALHLIGSFGPIAFGTAVLVILWRVIVKPELDARRMETDAMQAQIKAMSELNQQIRQTAELQAATTQNLTGMLEVQRGLLHDLKAYRSDVAARA